MRVLVLDGGDRTPYLSRLAARLAGLGVEMHYAADARHKDFEALGRAGVACHPVRIRHKLDLPARREVRRLLDEHRIDVLQTVTGRDAYTGIKARGRRPVRTLVRRGAYARVSRLDPADRAVYGRRGADLFLAVSRHLASHLVARGVARERVTTVYTGIWSEDLECGPPRDLRRELGLGEGVFLGGFVGNDRPVKGFDLLLDALVRLVRDGVPVHVVVAGSGFDAARGAIQERGLGERVHLLGHAGDVWGVLRGIDALLVTSRIDALPRTVIEATVAGTPVLATAVGGIPEILDGGRCGVLTEPGDAAGFARAVRDAAGDPARLRTLAAAALERNRPLFSIDRSARDHATIYSKLNL